VPLTTGGKLRIVVSADLGGLGAKDGAPVNFNWTMSGIAPRLLPWLVILGLLVLKSNRCAAAWLIWLPLGAVMALTFLPPPMPSGANFFLDAIAAMAFGLAAVWLLSNHLRQSHRLLSFFCVLLAMSAFSALGFVFRQGLNDMGIETLQIAVVTGVGVLASALALSVSGWICRNGFRPLGIYLWLFVSLSVAWLLIAAPFFIFAVMASGGRIPWSEFFLPILGLAAGNFALLLPFLILSSASPFHRERLKALLNVKSEAPPTLLDAAVKT
jgi:hypothetical protein